jgi:phosphohistidine phosphatase
MKNVTFLRICAPAREELPSDMEIFLLRHGLAVERGTPGFKDDSARPLLPKGKKQLKKTARAMREMDLAFDLILSSPYLRAKETAEIVVAGLKGRQRLKFSSALAAEKEPLRLIGELQKIKPAPKTILLVGHEPFLSRLISLLVTGGPDLQMDFAKGGLAKLEVDTLQAGKCAVLAWLLTPRQMKLMA